MYIKKKFWLRFFCNEMNAKYVTWLFFQKNIWVYLGLNISLCSPFKCSITSYHMTIFFLKKIYSLLIFSFVIWKKKCMEIKPSLFFVYTFSQNWVDKGLQIARDGIINELRKMNFLLVTEDLYMYIILKIIVRKLN